MVFLEESKKKIKDLEDKMSYLNKKKTTTSDSRNTG